MGWVANSLSPSSSLRPLLSPPPPSPPRTQGSLSQCCTRYDVMRWVPALACGRPWGRGNEGKGWFSATMSLQGQCCARGQGWMGRRLRELRNGIPALDRDEEGAHGRCVPALKNGPAVGPGRPVLPPMRAKGVSNPRAKGLGRGGWPRNRIGSGDCFSWAGRCHPSPPRVGTYRGGDGVTACTP